jgi:hypothetical protein
MRPSRSRSRSAAKAPAVALAALAALGLALAPRPARAQACCAGASALTPARLAPAEDAILGLQTRATVILGSFDGARRFVPASRGSAEIDLEQDLAAAVRVFSKAQIAALLPLVETYRRVPGLAEAGVGLGDVQLGARYDVSLAGQDPRVPGLALALALTLPTGRSPEAASNLLATDATGTGAFQAALTLSLEQIFSRRVLASLAGSAALRAPRVVGTITEQQGASFLAYAACGYVFDRSALIALTTSYAANLDATIDGVRAPNSARAATRAGLVFGASLSDAWRLQGAAFSDLPIPGFGLAQPLGAGLTLMLTRVFI